MSLERLAFGWPLHSWSRSDLLVFVGDLIALVGVLVAIVGVSVTVVPPLRRGLLMSVARHRYAAWFVRTWGVYENPYLNDTENLDLSNTYVPLSFRSEDAGREILSIAADVLADARVGNLVIDGAPGSGKSTLLKAYGVGMSRPDRLLRRRGRTTPFLIMLRKLARSGEQLSVADYLVSDILVSDAGMSPERARRFLRYVLGKGQALVMLDGLDEVTPDRYQAVLEAVYAFTHNHAPNCPSYRARVIVTCRRQNFLSLQDQWIPAIASRVCSLAPLRDSEIFSYLGKLRLKFKAAGGPAAFFQAVRASGTLDLHRVPLILAMSVGLYAPKAYYEIPNSIAELYREMIDEMLDRHRFKRNPGGSALRFQLADKRRFLREFALKSAAKSDRFDEFSRASLVDVARSLVGDLNAVSDPDAFVGEITDHSGLLTDVAEGPAGEGVAYLFAHRSIQEFLAAKESVVSGGGAFLLDRARNPEWRQVIQFYASALEQQQANEFLRKLAARNPELAGYCLAVAKPSDSVAATVLDGLARVDRVQLTALAAATMSPRLSVQRMAIDRLRQALSDPKNPLSALSGEVDPILPLLSSLAGANAAEIADLVPQVIERLPDDPRLVEPLWRCLAAPGIEERPACRAIALRLLALATTPDGFAELARQDRYSHDFLTKELRRQAYPFNEGLDPDHNLVTLLAWAQYLHVSPDKPNRYFEAKIAGRLDRIEADRKLMVSFSLFWPARLLSATLWAGAIIAAPFVGRAYPSSIHVFGLAAVFTFLSATGIPMLQNFYEEMLCKIHLWDINGHFVAAAERLRSLVESKAGFWIILLVFLVAPIIATSGDFYPLKALSTALYIILLILYVVLYIMPMLPVFEQGRHYYLYRPNPYVDLYDDPRSRMWVAAAAVSTSQ